MDELAEFDHGDFEMLILLVVHKWSRDGCCRKSKEFQPKATVLQNLSDFTRRQYKAVFMAASMPIFHIPQYLPILGHGPHNLTTIIPSLACLHILLL